MRQMFIIFNILVLVPVLQVDPQCVVNDNKGNTAKILNPEKMISSEHFSRLKRQKDEAI